MTGSAPSVIKTSFKEDLMAPDGSRRFSSAGLAVIATVARLLCRELTLENEYLRLENRILRSKVQGRIGFTDDERWSLMKAALAMGRELMRKVVAIVRPDTILAWQRRLEQNKWDYSRRRRRGPGRPRTSGEVEALVCRMARENTWGCKCLCSDFDAVLRSAGVKPVKTPYHAPNASSFAERWIRSAREDCPNPLILFGIKSLRRVVHTYARSFNGKRPHQGIENRVPSAVRTGHRRLFSTWAPSISMPSPTVVFPENA